ncbi:MAG: amidase [Burkholderiaceae bacterium]
MLDAPEADRLALARRLVESTEARLHAWRMLGPEGERLPGGAAPIPIGVKDVIDVAGMPTRAGSATRADALPCEADAAVLALLRRKGYLPIGKTHTTEFAYLDPAPTTNPFNASHTPGGSSSGSAAAVGAGTVPVALGTQTAGSVCRPAAFCGIHAFKPTTGRTPREGVVPLAPSFDTVGAYGLTLAWAVDVAMCMLGESSPPPRAERLRIGVIADPFYLAVQPRVQRQIDACAEVLRGHGHQLLPLQTGEDFAEMRVRHRRAMQYEAGRAHGRLLVEQPDRVGPRFRELLQAGAALTEDDHAQDIAYLQAARRRILSSMAAFDAVLLPPAYDTAPEGLSSTGDASLITPWTCVGSPLAVLPTGLSDEGLPLAVMLAGQPGRDRALAACASAVDLMLAGAGLRIDAKE